jgi:hypothetical protein
MLVSEEDFVKVHRDRDFIVREIAKPSAIGTDGVGQQR